MKTKLGELLKVIFKVQISRDHVDMCSVHYVLASNLTSYQRLRNVITEGHKMNRKKSATLNDWLWF